MNSSCRGSTAASKKTNKIRHGMMLFRLIKKLLFCLLLLCNFAVNAQTNDVPDKSLQKLTVLLDWYINPDHAPLFVAQQQGYFRQQGLDVQFIAPADPADPPKLVAAGKADIAIDYQPHVLLEITQGLPLVQIGSLIDTPLSCLATDPAITTIKDLKGKRIAYSVGSVDIAILQGMLLHSGLTLKDVELVNVKYDLTQGLLSKKVEAATGLMRNVELIQLQLFNHPVNVFYPETNGVPSYEELVFVTHRHLRQDSRIPRFLTAVAEGVKYLRQHPEQSWQMFAKAHPELNNELNHRSWMATLPHFSTNPAKREAARCEKLAIFLRKMLDTPISPQTCK